MAGGIGHNKLVQQSTGRNCVFLPDSALLCMAFDGLIMSAVATNNGASYKKDTSFSHLPNRTDQDGYLDESKGVVRCMFKWEIRYHQRK